MTLILLPARHDTVIGSPVLKKHCKRSLSPIDDKKMIVHNYFTFPLICGNMKVVYFPAVLQPSEE
ncbi:hypothetical protein D4F06_17760 [Salmonella enterica subsp. enterica serovar Muenchen]|nr:hypothetical protein [Salmonella enterica subsp. enterica serovar Muenchen]EBY3556146.1 hypothetical protein [Salmonella enterica subsp. enterica serovar Muenchen]ECJ4482672.1 hypothetical protein [Salmonella enterica subsp. diarizonae]